MPGANAYLEQNPNATLPTLVADGKSYTSTKDVISYLVETAPKKVAKGTAFIDKVHDDHYDPNSPLLLAVRALHLRHREPYPGGVLFIIHGLNADTVTLAQ